MTKSMKEPLFSLAKQFNLCSLITLMLTIGIEICHTNISVCLLSISTCLVAHDMNYKTNEELYSQNT